MAYPGTDPRFRFPCGKCPGELKLTRDTQDEAGVYFFLCNGSCKRRAVAVEFMGGAGPKGGSVEQRQQPNKPRGQWGTGGGNDGRWS